MIGFERVRSFDNFFNTNLLGLQGELDAKDVERLRRIREAWNFYDGYHWEELPEQDTPELTVNYCRVFVDKYVAFELGKAFSFITSKKMDGKFITDDERTVFDYLEDVWEDNDQYLFVTELGQIKSVTGEAWVQVRYYDPSELDDPYGEYENGRVKLLLLPTQTVFPVFDPHQRGVLQSLTVMYTYEKVSEPNLFGRVRKEEVIYKQVWTKDNCTVIDGKDEPVTFPNKYGVIPFVQIKNIVEAGRNEGRGDLDDIIPLNTEYNMKESDISEIIDYHAAPVTIVYGAKIGNLEKGANKMWGGIPKDAKVENLELKSDLGASSNHTLSLKLAMCEVGGIPLAAMGGAQAISNTSGVALEYINMPLVEKTRVKRQATENGLEHLNKLILLVSMLEGLVKKPKDVKNRDFFWTSVTVPDTLPKDKILELQQIQTEMQLGLESREGALERLGRENIADVIERIDKEKEKEMSSLSNENSMNPNNNSNNEEDMPELNSGFTNGQTPIETVRKEVTGQNGGAKL